jgi:phosphohistidine phosphatase SixA
MATDTPIRSGWTRLIAIRHPAYNTETANNETAPLTGKGLDMAGAVARNLGLLLANETSPTIVRSSPAERTKALARLIGQGLRVTPIQVPWLLGPAQNPSALMMYLAKEANGGTIILCAHEPFVNWLLARSNHRLDAHLKLGDGHQFQIDPATGDTKYYGPL